MRRRASFIEAIVLVGLAFGLVSIEPVAATGVGNIEFNVGGTLPLFPCDEGCQTTFSGSGTGAGNLTFEVDGVTHNATFTIVGGTVSGSAEYSEPGGPFCPAFGFAASPTTGSVTLSGGATGIIFRTNPLLPGGTVFDVSTTLGFSYTRVGVTPVIEITGGSVTVRYFIPGSGTGSVTESIVTGEGSGVFVVDPVQAASRCQNPGELAFSIIGDAVLALI